MAGINRIQLIGHLGADPELKEVPSGKQVCTFRVAVDRRWRSADKEANQDPDWFNVETWGRLGEICGEYLSKGRLVYLEGRVQTDRYEQDGQTRYFTKVIAEQMQMLDRRAGAVEAGEAT